MAPDSKVRRTPFTKTKSQQLVQLTHRNLQASGLYQHISPPRAVPALKPAHVQQWLKEGNVARLEQLVTDGQGHRLLGERPPQQAARLFMRSLPGLMARQEAVHEAAQSGRSEEVVRMLQGVEGERLAVSKDAAGLGLLHKAVLRGHHELAQQLVTSFPATVALRDHEGRTALHYCGASPDPGRMWSLLETAGADQDVVDRRGNRARYYMNHKTTYNGSGTSVASSSQRNVNMPSSSELPIAVTRAHIRKWIHERDLPKLERLVWAGQGERLLPETSGSPRVRRFLEAVPFILSIIKEMHVASVTNNVPLWRMRTSTPVPTQLLLSQDKNGLTPLHKAAGLGHVEIVSDILQRAPEGARVKDVNRRLPLHYAAVRKDTNDAYQLLVAAGADDSLPDGKGHSASYYAQHPGELDVASLKLSPDATRAPSTLPSSWNWSMLVHDTESVVPKLGKPPLPAIPRALNPSFPKRENAPPLKPENPPPSKTQPPVSTVPKPENPAPPPRTGNLPPNPLVSKYEIPPPDSPKPTLAAKLPQRPPIEPALNNVLKTNNSLVPTHPRTSMSTLSMAAAALSYMRTPPMRNHEFTPPTTFSFSPNVSTRAPLTANYIKVSPLSKTYPSLIPQTAPMLTAPAVVANLDLQIPSSAPISMMSTVNPAVPNTNPVVSSIIPAVPSTNPVVPSTNAVVSSTKATVPTTNTVLPIANSVVTSTKATVPTTNPELPIKNPTVPNTDQAKQISNGHVPKNNLKHDEEIIRSDEEEHNVGSPLRPISPAGTFMPTQLLERWVRAGDLARLEDALLEGRGPRLMKLLGSAARNKEFRAFIERAPGFMDGMRRMHAASGAGDEAEVRSLVGTYRRIVLARDEEGAQPMHVAARAGNEGVLRLLLREYPRGAAVPDWESRTPLHHAGMCSDVARALPCYQLLLVHGAPENAKDAIGNKASDYLAETRSHQPGVEGFDEHVDLTSSRLTTGEAVPDTPPAERNRTAVLPNPSDLRKNTANVVDTFDSRMNSANIDTPPALRPSTNTVTALLNQHVNAFPATPQDQKVTVVAEAPPQGQSVKTPGARVNGSLISKDLSVPQTPGRFDPALEEAKRLVEGNNTEKLADMVLNGHGEKLLGLRSNNPYVQGLIDHVPIYMGKIAAVHEAAERGDMVTLQASLERRKFVTSRDKFGATPLHKAVLFAQMGVSRYLGGRFPETLDAQDHAGRGPLHYAAVLPDRGALYRTLLALGADPRLRDRRGHTALDYELHHEQRRNHEQLLSELGADPAFAAHTPDPGRAAASAAAATATLDMLQQPLPPDATFVKPDPQPVAWTQEGQYLASTAVGDPLLKGLMEVSSVRPKDPITYLANYLYTFPNSKTHQPSSPPIQQQPAQVTGVVRGMPEVAADNQGPAPGTTASKRADSRGLQSAGSMTSAAGSTNRDEHGQSMLHFASARSHSRNAFAQLLREAGLSVGQRDALYRTPRDVAIEAGLPENARDIDNWVLHIALEGDTDRLEELLLDGYDHILDVKDSSGASIVEMVQRSNVQDSLAFLKSIPAFEGKREWVHKAIRVGSLEHVREMLNSGHLAVARNSKGRCSLHVAALCQQEHIVEYIANKFPVTLGAGDNLERTALHYAMAMDKAEVLSMVLVKAGAKRVLKDLKGRQASFYFVNRTDVMKLKEEELQERPKK